MIIRKFLDIVGFENISELTYIDNNVTRDDYVYGIRALDGANQLGTGTVGRNRRTNSSLYNNCFFIWCSSRINSSLRNK